ncbi:hypothetical protein EHP00_1610 [Ecytonucleospora hepatopenaei]|uniref:Uncharacterized protein n=1 Tax=Ecytonucleospora hepatopenaei TaxID=646526 RepID=A0A1W0E979_9MICR|nr:hypothetical protein EHP00_1610 [Ecytonucleospora hepatopenaei]
MFIIFNNLLYNSLCYCSTFIYNGFFDTNNRSIFYSSIVENDVTEFFNSFLPHKSNTLLNKRVKKYLEKNNLPKEICIYQKNNFKFKIDLAQDSYSIASKSFVCVFNNYLYRMLETNNLVSDHLNEKELIKSQLGDIKLTEKEKNLLRQIKKEFKSCEVFKSFEKVSDLYRCNFSLLYILDNEQLFNSSNVKNVRKEIQNTKLLEYCHGLDYLYDLIRSVNEIKSEILNKFNKNVNNVQYYCYVVAFETLKDVLQVEDESFLKKLAVSQIELDNCDTSQKVLLYILEQLIYVLPQFSPEFKEFSKIFLKHKTEMHEIDEKFNELKSYSF